MSSAIFYQYFRCLFKGVLKLGLENLPGANTSILCGTTCASALVLLYYTLYFLFFFQINLLRSLPTKTIATNCSLSGLGQIIFAVMTDAKKPSHLPLMFTYRLFGPARTAIRSSRPALDLFIVPFLPRQALYF